MNGLACVLLAAVCHIADPKIIVMRHGQAMHNIKDLYNSNPQHFNYFPASLTEEGKGQAVATAKKLLEEGFNQNNIAAVFVSPLPRTMETAHILAETGLFSLDKLHVEPRLIEVEMGDLEGKPIMHAWQTSYAEEYHAESDASVNGRVEEFYKSLITSSYCGNILVITHGVPAHKLIGLISAKHTKLSTGEAQVFSLKMGTATSKER